MYHRSFVRGIFHRLSEKIISQNDFAIALKNCQIENGLIEQKISITDAIKSWSPEWRQHFDEKMKSEERLDANNGRNCSSTPFEEGRLDEPFDDNSSDDKEESDEATNAHAPNLPISPNPTDSEYKTIDFNLPRKKGFEEEEKYTETQCTKLVYENISHYFKEFEDENFEISTFFFVEPDHAVAVANGSDYNAKQLRPFKNCIVNVFFIDRNF